MRFNLTQASHRVFERASRLRLQRGIAAISSAKILWALFEEDECRAAQWLGEAKLSLAQFMAAFGIAALQSPISAPAFPAGNYGISAGQYTPPPPPSDAIEAAATGNNSHPVGNPYTDSSSSEPEHEPPSEPDEQIQDDWQPSEPTKYSLYQRQQGEQRQRQSRLQFFLDDQHVHVGLLTPELEDALESAAHRFLRQEYRQSISISGGIKQIARGMPTCTLLTEHLLLAVVLDNSDVGRWLRDNGLEADKLYARINALSNESRERNEAGCPGKEEEELEPSLNLQMAVQIADESDTRRRKPAALDCRLPPTVCRLMDAAANRGREAVRVIEDYVRFMLDDAGLTQRLKTFRHQFQDILQQFPVQDRLSARNTESDVGAAISAEGEYHRSSVYDILSANFSRLQESLRSLEEFSKMSDPQTARQFERLRYECYTLHKDVASATKPQFLDCRQIAQSKNCVSAVCRCLADAQLYALIDIRSDELAFERLVTGIIAGGVNIIQLRDKQADERMLLARSRILKQCIAASGREVLFIMNDRPDLALLAEADGVHVGQNELPTALVRHIVGDLLVGVSTHSIEQARQAVLDGADYIGAGPVFASVTKEFSQLAGVEYLREVAAEIAIPAFAIGGITEERLDEVLQTGIRRVAVGSALLQAENPKEIAERFLMQFKAC